MFEAGHTPLRPPLKPTQQAAPPETGLREESPRPEPATAANAPRRLRRTVMYMAVPAKLCTGEARFQRRSIAAAKEMATRAAHDIGRPVCGTAHPRRMSEARGKACSASDWFRGARAGRRPKKPQVTAAYSSTGNAGTRGVALFRKHIPGWTTHNHYRRVGEQKALLDAIRSRSRRENKEAE